MSLAQITQKIEQDAGIEAKAVMGKAREQEEQIKKSTDAEIKKIEEAAKARFGQERPEIFKRRGIVANLDVAKLHLGAQRALIRDVFEGLLKRLDELPQKEYLDFCGQLLKKAAESGDEVLEISKNEKFIDAAWLDDFNAKNKTKLSLSKNRQDFSGGFLLNKGRICINCSWEMLVQVARERLETEVVKRLSLN